MPGELPDDRAQREEVEDDVASKMAALHDQIDELELENERLKAEAGAGFDETGIGRIAAERKRQTEEEGWTPEHDAEHSEGELAIAAACYALEGSLFARVDHVFGETPKDRGSRSGRDDPWPWHRNWDKRQKHPPIRRLAIGGALLAAEIDRLQAEQKRRP